VLIPFARPTFVTYYRESPSNHTILALYVLVTLPSQFFFVITGSHGGMPSPRPGHQYNDNIIHGGINHLGDRFVEKEYNFSFQLSQ
jgi:hypothetical protein